jgi:hypothetical protein
MTHVTYLQLENILDTIELLLESVNKARLVSILYIVSYDPVSPQLASQCLIPPPRARPRQPCQDLPRPPSLH